MRRLIVCFVAGWTVCLGATEPAKRPLKVLMIGNSFSQSVMDVTPDIANSMGQQLDIVSMFVGGCTLERHWQNVLAPTSAPYRISWSHKGVRGFKYPAVERALRDSMLPSWNPPHDLIPVKGSNVEDMLKADKWDVVTLQQASHFSALSASYHPWGENLLKRIRELAPQARILVQQTWAYPSWEKRLAENGGSSEEMYRRVASAYSAFAERHGLEIIPVGAAVRVLGDSDLLFTKPDFHLNLQGKYLQVLVWVATLFRVDVSDCRYLPKWLEPQMAGRLKVCAMKAVRETTSRTFCPRHVGGIRVRCPEVF